MNGIINVIKPAGLSSSAVISKIRKKLNVKRVGHLGTLDPDATGVLPICVGKATRLFDYFLNKTKTYRAIFVFGKATDTLDSSGKILNISSVIPTKQQIEKCLPDFLGKIEQIPPKYSAKNVKGVKAYKLARNNDNFSLEKKVVEILNFKLVEQINSNAFLFEISCSSGTYVRSLCVDLASKLNTVAYVGAIIRTQTGDFLIKNACLLNEINETSIIKIENVLENAKKILVPNEFYDKINNGVKVTLNNVENSKNVVFFCKNVLIGLGDIENNIIVLKSYLKEDE